MKGLSNPFFNSFMKMKNRKWSVFRFPFVLWKWKMNGVLKIQRKTLLNMKMVVKYLNFVFQFMKSTKCHTLGTRIFFSSPVIFIYFFDFIFCFFIWNIIESCDKMIISNSYSKLRSSPSVLFLKIFVLQNIWKTPRKTYLEVM